MKQLRGGAFARMGLFVALMVAFGRDYAEMQWTKRRGSSSSGHSNRPAEGKSGSKRPGFKLIKRMARLRPNPGWERLHPRPIHSGKNRGHSSAWLREAKA